MFEKNNVVVSAIGFFVPGWLCPEGKLGQPVIIVACYLANNYHRQPHPGRLASHVASNMSFEKKSVTTLSGKAFEISYVDSTTRLQKRYYESTALSDGQARRRPIARPTSVEAVGWVQYPNQAFIIRHSAPRNDRATH